jgi:hypothetical protein
VRYSGEESRRIAAKKGQAQAAGNWETWCCMTGLVGMWAGSGCTVSMVLPIMH